MVHCLISVLVLLQVKVAWGLHGGQVYCCTDSSTQRQQAQMSSQHWVWESLSQKGHWGQTWWGIERIIYGDVIWLTRRRNSPPTRFSFHHNWEPVTLFHHVCKEKFRVIALCFCSHRYVRKLWSCWARTRSTTIRERWRSSARTASTRCSHQSRRPRLSRASSTLITQVCAPHQSWLVADVCITRALSQLHACLLRQSVYQH